jgi:serum/glucocorticoid-regulated kinase 2
LEKDPANRLGSKSGLEEILQHPFLSTINFEDLVGKKIEPPFKPRLTDDLMDVSNFDQQFTSEEAINSVIPTSKMEQIKKHKA